jgi:hypothetical protein
VDRKGGRRKSTRREIPGERRMERRGWRGCRLNNKTVQAKSIRRRASIHMAHRVYTVYTSRIHIAVYTSRIHIAVYTSRIHIAYTHRSIHIAYTHRSIHIVYTVYTSRIHIAYTHRVYTSSTQYTHRVYTSRRASACRASLERCRRARAFGCPRRAVRAMRAVAGTLGGPCGPGHVAGSAQLATAVWAAAVTVATQGRGR